MAIKINKFFLFIIILIVLLIGAGLIKKYLEAKKPKPHEIPPRPVQAAAATTKDAPVYVKSFGNLMATNNVNIISQVTGKILAAHFKEGDQVSPGDLLFSIDPRSYQADLDQAEAALDGDTVNLKLKKDTLERNKNLIAKNLISQQEFESYQTDADAAEAQVQSDKAAIEQAKLNLEYCQICSPIPGVTGKRLVDPGNIVTANNGPELVNIQTIDPLYVDFTVPERNLPSIRENMAKGTLQVKFDLSDDNKEPYDGELEFIDNTVDNTTGTIALRATVANKENQLWAGQFVTIHLIVSTLKNAVLVPQPAVRLGAKGKYIYVIKPDNTAELRENITVGQLIDDNLVIEKGVQPGEQVVTFGQLGLSDGAKVTIVSGTESKKEK